MRSFGFTVPGRATTVTTGVGTSAAAVFGGHALNLAAISAALAEVAGPTSAAVTFLVAASGLQPLGVGAAFWALVVRLVVRATLHRPRREEGRGEEEARG